MCLCGTDRETNEHFLQRCHCFSDRRSESDNLYNLDPSFSQLNDKEKVTYLLYGSASNPNTFNKVVINLVIKFLKSTGRFKKPLVFEQRKVFFSDFHFISKYFSFLIEIILSLNIIIYFWLLFTNHYLKFIQIFLSNE